MPHHSAKSAVAWQRDAARVILQRGSAVQPEPHLFESGFAVAVETVKEQTKRQKAASQRTGKPRISTKQAAVGLSDVQTMHFAHRSVARVCSFPEVTARGQCACRSARARGTSNIDLARPHGKSSQHTNSQNHAFPSSASTQVQYSQIVGRMGGRSDTHVGHSYSSKISIDLCARRSHPSHASFQEMSKPWRGSQDARSGIGNPNLSAGR